MAVLGAGLPRQSLAPASDWSSKDLLITSLEDEPAVIDVLDLANDGQKA
jgi:hypothetical protein